MFQIAYNVDVFIPFALGVVHAPKFDETDGKLRIESTDRYMKPNDWRAWFQTERHILVTVSGGKFKYTRAERNKK